MIQGEERGGKKKFLLKRPCFGDYLLKIKSRFTLDFVSSVEAIVVQGSQVENPSVFLHFQSLTLSTSTFRARDMSSPN